MSWARLDDTAHGHPKFTEAGLEAVGLWTLMLSHCAGYLTDGRVKRGDALLRAGSAEKLDELAKRLVAAGLWELLPSGDGWQVHDYLEFNPSRVKVLADREARKAGGQKGAAKRWSGAAPIGPPMGPVMGGPMVAPIGSRDAPVPSRPVPVPTQIQKRDRIAPAAPLTLTGEATRKPATRPKGPKSADVEASSPDLQALKLHYAERYAAAHDGQAPTFSSWSRAMAALRELLELRGSLDAARAVVTNAMADAWTAKNRPQPWELVADVNKHLVAPTSGRKNGFQETPPEGRAWESGLDEPLSGAG